MTESRLEIIDFKTKSESLQMNTYLILREWGPILISSQGLKFLTILVELIHLQDLVLFLTPQLTILASLKLLCQVRTPTKIWIRKEQTTKCLKS